MSFFICCHGSAEPVPLTRDPQQMLIFWVLLIFRIINVGLIILVTRKRLTYYAAKTDGIACRSLNYGVWNACET